jgi:hypothetical protein
MYKPQRAVCIGTWKHEGCGDLGIIMTNSRKLCQECESKRKPKKAIKQVSSKKRDRIDSGESEMPFFTAIWATRPHRCTVCKEALGDELKPSFFSHILSKGAFPAFRLLDINVVIKCEVCHHEYGTIAQSTLLNENYEKWYKIFELKEELIEKYYARERFED